MQKDAGSANSHDVTTSYLLNIYPYSAGDRDKALVGTVEKLGREGKQAFHSVEELLHLLEIECGGQGHD